MKKYLCCLFIIAALFAGANLKAQELNIPQPSTTQTLSQDFGLGKIVISYSRPNVRGRKIFGGLEPYGTVWRTGANAATTIKFTDEVTIAGTKVPAGTYSLFTIPDPDEWTIILNKKAEQWGAYDYKQAEDFMRFKIKPTTLRDNIETFTLQLSNIKSTSCDLSILWEKTAVRFSIETDVDKQVMSTIDLAMQSERKPYFAAAVYYYENNKDLKKALEWVTEAEKTDQKAPYYKLWKARIQLKMGNKSAALATATEGAKVARASNNDEYVRLNESLIAQIKRS
jgi:hypothetical protein